MEHALTRPHELAAALEQQCDLTVPLERAAAPTRPVGTLLFRREATERAAAGRALDPPARVEGPRQQHLAPGPPHQSVLAASLRNEYRKVRIRGRTRRGRRHSSARARRPGAAD